MKALGDGMFYLSTDSEVDGLQTSDIELFRWRGSPHGPFEKQTEDVSLARS
jgi:hypothetical protein